MPSEQDLDRALADLEGRIIASEQTHWRRLAFNRLTRRLPDVCYPFPDMRLTSFDTGGECIALAPETHFNADGTQYTSPPYPVELWPITLDNATITSRSEITVPNATAYFTLTLRALADIACPINRVTFWITVSSDKGAILYDSMALSHEATYARGRGYSQKVTLSFVGLDAGECLCPIPMFPPSARRFTEWSVFPEKCNAFSVSGLHDFVWKEDHILKIVIALRAPPCCTLAPEDHGLIRLNCAPLVNLFSSPLHDVEVKETEDGTSLPRNTVYSIKGIKELSSPAPRQCRLGVMEHGVVWRLIHSPNEDGFGWQTRLRRIAPAQRPDQAPVERLVDLSIIGTALEQPMSLRKGARVASDDGLSGTFLTDACGPLHGFGSTAPPLSHPPLLRWVSSDFQSYFSEQALLFGPLPPNPLAVLEMARRNRVIQAISAIDVQEVRLPTNVPLQRPGEPVGRSDALQIFVKLNLPVGHAVLMNVLDRYLPVLSPLNCNTQLMVMLPGAKSWYSCPLRTCAAPELEIHHDAEPPDNNH